ncbi:MAG: cation diffusion facilitator family transporter [Methanomassiliicoccales archaeon]
MTEGELKGSGSGTLRAGENAAGVATLTKLFLTVVKGLVGFLTGSVALLADALNSGVDVIVSSVSWVSLRLVQRSPDEEFQYGYYKVENLAALIISAFVVYAAISLGMEGYDRLWEVSEITEPWLAMGAAALSALVCLLLMRYLTAKSRETNSSSLMALAKDTMADVLSSLIVLVAIASSFYAIPYIEGAVSIGISILVLKVGLETAKDAMFSLLDVSPSKDIEQRVMRVAKDIPGVKEVKSVKLRRSGPVILGDLVVTTSRSLDVGRAHDIADETEEAAKKAVEGLELVMVHIEPSLPEEQVVAIPLREDRGIDSPISPTLGRAPKMGVVKVDEQGWRLLKVMENEFRHEEALAGLSLGKHLVGKERVDTVISESVGEVLFHTLRDNYIEIFRGRGSTLRDAVSHLMNGELELMLEPTKESRHR